MLQIQNLSFERAGVALFDQINFSFGTSKYGLVGRNGVGKSTLAKLLCGKLSPSEGRIIGVGRAQYFAQSESKSGHLRDFVTPAMLRHLGDLEIDLDRSAQTLSGGEWMRIRLSRILAEPPDLLILDEPTNNLDHKGKKVVFDFIRRYHGTLILISHDRDALRLMDEIVELKSRSIQRYGGDFDFFWSERERLRTLAKDEVESAQREKRRREQKRQEEIDAQEKRIRRGNAIGAKGGIPKIVRGMKKRQAQMTAAKIKTRWDDSVDRSSESLADAQESFEIDPFLRLDFESSAGPASKTLFSVENLNFKLSRPLWETPIRFQMKARERWQLKGANGSGKSTLLRAMARGFDDLNDCRAPSSGVVYLDQDQTLLNDSESVLENVATASRFSMSELRNELAFYGFTKDKVHQKVASLSGGERLRAALAKIFLGDALPQAILLDEPTNNFDFQSLDLLEKALNAFEGLLVIASHDDEFVSKLRVTQTLELK